MNEIAAQNEISGPTLAMRVAQASHDARGADSPATVRSYGAGVKRFARWCDETGRDYALPVDPRTLAAFVDDMGEVLAVASVSLYVTAINRMHNDLNLSAPAGASVVKLALRRLRRAKGVRQKQAKPLRWEQINELLEAIGNDLPALRDAALIALAYDTMCRASELVALRTRDIQNANDGTESGRAFVAASKTDQEGAGAFKFVAPDTMHRLRAWIDAASLEDSDYLFFSLSPVELARPADHLSPRDVARIYKRRTGEEYSAHSTRVGSALDQHAAGVETGLTAQAGGWKSDAMVRRYTAEQDAGRGGAAVLAKAQGRV